MTEIPSPLLEKPVQSNTRGQKFSKSSKNRVCSPDAELILGFIAVVVIKDIFGTVLLDPVEHVYQFIAIENFHPTVFVILPDAIGTGESFDQYLRAPFE